LKYIAIKQDAGRDSGAISPFSARTRMLVLLFATALLASAAHAFVVPPLLDFGHPAFLLSDEAAAALSPVVFAGRKKFYFYFLAGSGAAGIGVANLPNVFQEANVARAAAGTGPTQGGTALDCGPLPKLYYSTEILEADVAEAIQKAPTADFISKRSTGTSYLATRGYIVKDDFVKELIAKKCNPLASYALFDAMSSGKGFAVSPVVYESKLTGYRDNASSGGGVVSSFGSDLNGFLAVKVGAFFGLVFALFVDVALVANAGIAGFGS